MRRPSRIRILHLATMAIAFTMSVTATLSWAWTGGLDQMGGPAALGSPVVTGPVPQPATGDPRAEAPPAGPVAAAAAPGAGAGLVPVGAAAVSTAPRRAAVVPSGSPRAATTTCRTGAKLVPTCGVLWGVAPGAFTDQRGAAALAAFERRTGRHQDIYHAYHRGTKQLFPTAEEIAIARQPGRERLLLLNWRPTGASWARIAKGDRRTDRFLDRLAEHINRTYPERFFLAVHHEAENDVRPKPGSGYTARDYAKMYRHVIERLRARGVDNAVSVLVHMAYVPHTTKKWFPQLYPGDDVVDWIGFDTYAYSDPGYGHGDFAELLNRRMRSKPSWPGFYDWAVRRHPGKPLMVAEWGVWSSKRNPGHKADFYREIGRQITAFPKIRAMVHFETPRSEEGRDSRVEAAPGALEAYRRLGRHPAFQVDVRAQS